MKKLYAVVFLSIFLAGCSFGTHGNENHSSEIETSMGDTEHTVDNDFHNYSGDWVFWNNPAEESEGGVSLSIEISDQFVEASLSAWSENYNRLADTELSGILRGNKAILPFGDDGRGQAGTIYLTLEKNSIQMQTVTTEESRQGDFTFPEGPTTLYRVVADEEKPVYYSDGNIQDLQNGDIESCYITDRATGLNHYFIDDQNILWGTGRNDLWQLGIEDENDRGNLDTVYSEPIQIAENVIHVDASDNGYFVIYITEDHELYGLGANTSGVLRQPVQEFEELNLSNNIIAEPVKLMDRVQFASAGRQSLSVLDEEGNVWWWGRFLGTTGTEAGSAATMYSEEPRCMIKNARYVICGGDFAAAIDKNDRLWTWGNNVWGQCGTEPVRDYIEEAVNICDDVDMVWVELLSSKQNKIAAEELNDDNPYSSLLYPYTMFVQKNDGNIYACGINLGKEKRNVQVYGDMEREDKEGYTYSYSSKLVPIEVQEF